MEKNPLCYSCKGFPDECGECELYDHDADDCLCEVGETIATEESEALPEPTINITINQLNIVGADIQEVIAALREAIQNTPWSME